LPFKLNADRRHPIPKQTFEVTNSLGALLCGWHDYDASLRQRGSLTVWVADEAVAAWTAEPRTTRGGQRTYSALAILTALTLRAVFWLALRQTEGLIGSVIRLLRLDLAVPGHFILSRRAETLEVPRPGARAGAEPLHPLVDSTGPKLRGAGEWLHERHGTKVRRSWRKLHLGLDARTGKIVASLLTSKDVDDGSQVGPLLDQVQGPVASFTGDGADDQDGVTASVAARHPQTVVIVPPRANAAPSETAETAPTQRGHHLQHVKPRGSPDIAEHGRMARQKASGYTGRARAEAGMARFKPVIGDGRSRPRFHVRSTWNAGGRCAHTRTSARRPRWRSLSMSSTARWSLDARIPSAPPDHEPGVGLLRPPYRPMQQRPFRLKQRPGFLLWASPAPRAA